jgi:hypothetical protein
MWDEYTDYRGETPFPGGESVRNCAELSLFRPKFEQSFDIIGALASG